MPKPISSTEFYEESAQFCQFTHRVAKFVFVQKLICIGIFKALPAFPKLDVKDQEMPEPISSSEFYKQSAQFCQYSYRVTKFFIVQKLICIGIFKSLPVFPKLDVKDQVIILQYVAPAVRMLGCCFSTYEMGSSTLMRKDGFYPMAAFSDQFSLKNDKT
uniref:NR LBD domain-containing protein n=1 Tax=Meloidogyne javanica TaxID=6303 RepID=A0A915LJ73_MELJA